MVRAAALAFVAAGLLAGCSEHPERACAGPDVAGTALDVLYEKVGRSIDGTDWPAGSIKVSGLHDQLQFMRATHFVRLRNPTLASYDKTVKLATCMAEAHFDLAAADRSPTVREILSQVPDLNLGAPAFSPDPMENITYGVQPDASGKGSTLTMDHVEAAIAEMFAIAFAREVQKERLEKTS